jgi:hypothetical protein
VCGQVLGFRNLPTIISAECQDLSNPTIINLSEMFWDFRSSKTAMEHTFAIDEIQ